MKYRAIWVIVAAVLVVIAVLVLVGAVAVARDNPPVTTTIQWDSPETEQLMRAACMDCHSNETVWPWYSYVAPMAFLVAKDVNEGRDALNLSTARRVEADEMVEKIQDGEMPPPIYLPLHPEANLTAEQKDALIAGIWATFGGEDGRHDGSGSGEAGEASESDNG